MTNQLELVVKSALLHDSGKVCFRSGGKQGTHSHLGKAFLAPLVEGAEGAKEFLHGIRYHHGKDLSKASLPNDDLAYIVYEADNIAAGADRRDVVYSEEGSENEVAFDRHVNLANIFNIFAGTGADSSFALRQLDGSDFKNYPLSGKHSDATQGDYEKIERRLKENFEKKNPLTMGVDELLRILHDTLLYVPSSTNKKEVSDISLYDHMKITGAIAGAMYRYLVDKGNTDYYNICYKENDTYRKENMFLLVSADFSGVQDFIYRVPKKGAMRLLRGRSFYLDILLEHVADELLGALGLSRCNLIYSGGGHFYLLVDNTEETKNLLEKGVQRVNERLMENFNDSIYLAYATEPVCADDLMGNQKDKQNPFARIGHALSLAKQKRYHKELLEELFDETSERNAVAQGAHECAICHRSVNGLKPYEADPEGDTEVCDVCNGLYNLGKKLLESSQDLDKNIMLAVLSEPQPHAVRLPSPFEERWLFPCFPKEASTLQEKGRLVRFYAKNLSVTGNAIGTQIWVADYAARDEYGRPLDLEELAQLSGTGEKGFDRLGVLRADVDSLGAAFMAGFRRTQGEEVQYETLSRYATLSGSLTLFFKRIITEVAKKRLPPGVKPFHLFENKDRKEREIHIVYSGGDDLFIVGAWDDLLEFAVDLQETFRIYTNGKLSFSGGLGLFSASYPMIQMAKMTGKLEDKAKSMEGKNSIALFGEALAQRNVLEEKMIPCYTWIDLKERIKKGKIDYLSARMYLKGINESNDSRLPVGKSLLYRLKLLLEAQTFNLARFAYVLARMVPERKKLSTGKKQSYEDLRVTLFTWGTNPKDRDELITAINLLLYRMRDK